MNIFLLSLELCDDLKKKENQLLQDRKAQKKGMSQNLPPCNNILSRTGEALTAAA